jgi:hypothetical protein
MAFVTITSDRIDVDSPVSDELLEDVKNNLDDLNSRAGALLDVPNGNMELVTGSAPDLWTVADYAGGSHSIDTTTPAEGASALKFSRTAGAGNGGGYADSQYLPITEYISPLVEFTYKSSVATFDIRVMLRYFDKGKVAISDEDIFSAVSGHPAAWTRKVAFGIPPATARFVKIRLDHHTQAAAGSSGDVEFDAVHYDPAPDIITADDTIILAESNTSSTTFVDIRTGSIKIPKGFKGMSLPIEVKDTGTAISRSRYAISTTYSSEFINPSAIADLYVLGWTWMDIAALSGTQTLAMQGAKVTAGTSTYVRKTSASAIFHR